MDPALCLCVETGFTLGINLSPTTLLAVIIIAMAYVLGKVIEKCAR
jgi:hypothetical protein